MRAVGGQLRGCEHRQGRDEQVVAPGEVEPAFQEQLLAVGADHFAGLAPDLNPRNRVPDGLAGRRGRRLGQRAGTPPAAARASPATSGTREACRAAPRRNQPTVARRVRSRSHNPSPLRPIPAPRARRRGPRSRQATCRGRQENLRRRHRRGGSGRRPHPGAIRASSPRPRRCASCCTTPSAALRACWRPSSCSASRPRRCSRRWRRSSSSSSTADRPTRHHPFVARHL